MKKIHHFKQWTNEKVGRAKKSEMDEEIKIMIQETDLQREYFERMHRTLSDYIHIYDKKIDTQEEKKIQPVYALGLLSINFGTIYPNDSAFGQALLQYGEAHSKLSENQSNFVINSRNSLLAYITNFLNEVKIYSALKKKHDHRRLDLDEIQARIKKSSKEKPQLIEELRVSQDKYEESLDELSKKMFDLNCCTNKHLEALQNFCLSELEYHKRSTEILSNVYDSISQMKEEGSERSSMSNTQNSSSPTYNKKTYRSSIDRYSQGENPPPYQSAISRDTSSLSSFNEYKYSSNRNETSSINQTIPEASVIATTIASRNQNNPPMPKNAIRQVRANFEFEAQSPDDLPMKVGDIINVLEEIDEGWWLGEMADGSGRTGMFPQNYTTEIKSNDSATTTNSSSLYPSLSTNNGTKSEYLPTDTRNYRKPSTGLASTQQNSNRNSTITTAAIQQQKLANKSVAGNQSYPGAAVNASLKKAREEAESQPQKNVGKCSTCGCEDYSLNLFKPPNCNNCFHTH